MNSLRPAVSCRAILVGATASIASTVASSGACPVLLLDQFSPGLGTLVGCGFDTTTGTVWVYDSFGPTVSGYTVSGGLTASFTVPGGTANDFDLEVAPENLTLGSTKIAAGTLIIINGESGTADLYAVNSTTGEILASLTTTFGVSHVVGGAYHPGRNTFFLVQDKVPGGVNANRVAEIDPTTGIVLNTWQTTGVYTVNFGDLEVNAATGNLLLVSSDESSIGEFTPGGSLVQERPLPTGVSLLSGIAMDDASGEAWVTGTGGNVWRLDGLPRLGVFGDIAIDGEVDVDDLLAVINAWGACPNPNDCPADLTGDDAVNVDDLLAVINAWGPCPP